MRFLEQVVLVVEDEPLLAVGLQQSLENVGAQVVRAGQHDASRIVDQGNLSVAVMDCHPASAERRALVRRLRQRRVPFLFYSVQPPGSVTTERGAQYVGKPCPPQKIIAAMRYLLRPL